MNTEPIRLPDPTDRPATALVRAAVRAADATDIVVLPERVHGGCRFEGCGHSRRAHQYVSHDGWRERCLGCRCAAYRKPWDQAVLDVAFWVTLVFFAALVVWGVWQ